MGEVIYLAEHSARRRGARTTPPALDRLDEAVHRLDALVSARAHVLGGLVERELRAIARDVSAGRPRLAARRADRLADRLEHPAALG